MARQRRILAKSNYGNISVIEEEVKPLRPGEILVEVVASVISPGTELGSVRPRQADAEECWRGFGYQNAGYVRELGEGVTGFHVGQRVACMGANYAVHGTWACVPVNLAVPLPDKVDFEEGAFVALAATALNAVQRADLKVGEYALVMGLGVVGQFAAQLAQIAGAHVLGADRLPLRLDTAKATGIPRVVGGDESLVDAAAEFTKGYGMDAGFICFGGEATAAFEELVKTIKKAPDSHLYGRVVIPGGAHITARFGAGLGNLDIRSAARTGPGYHDKEYEVGADYPKVFVPFTTQRNLGDVVDWIAAGKLNVRQLITHRTPLSEAPEVCRLIIEEPAKTLGVVVQHG